MATNSKTSSGRNPAATNLRALLARKDQVLVAPGVFDGLSARAALSVGFEAIYMTGAGTVASRLGQPDLGFAGLSEMSGHAEMIANLEPTVPLIADADTGYGGPNMVARTIERYDRAGVAGLHIEDQVQTKRCGHLGGKEVVSRDAFVQRIRAAYNARVRLGSDIVIIARTDALQTHDYEEARERLRLALAAGADVAFLEGFNSAEQGRAICKDLAPAPVLLNMVEHGATPTFTPEEAQEMGFRIVIFPFASIFSAYDAMRSSYEQLLKSGKTGLPATRTPKDLFRSVGLDQATAVDLAAGSAFLQGA